MRAPTRKEHDEIVKRRGRPVTDEWWQVPRPTGDGAGPGPVAARSLSDLSEEASAIEQRLRDERREKRNEANRQRSSDRNDTTGQ